MRPLICLVLAAAALAPVAACDSSPTGPTEPAVLILAPGQSGVAGGLTVKFIRVTADTRCPLDAFCIQILAGDAFVAIETSVFGARQEAELALIAPDRQSITRGGYTVTFEELNPHPFLSRPPIVPSAYRARFSITRR